MSSSSSRRRCMTDCKLWPADCWEKLITCLLLLHYVMDSGRCRGPRSKSITAPPTMAHWVHPQWLPSSKSSHWHHNDKTGDKYPVSRWPGTVRQAGKHLRNLDLLIDSMDAPYTALNLRCLCRFIYPLRTTCSHRWTRITQQVADWLYTPIKCPRCLP